MMEVRLALPQRSPRPLSVPWICRAPARTAASVLATAFSVSLWVWMPRCVPGTCLATSATISPISCGSVPPLVSHSTTQRAPAFVGGGGDGERVGAVALPAVEEMLAVDHGLAA